MKKCPRCSYELSINDKACPKCGLLVSQMEEIRKKFNLGEEETTEQEIVSKRPSKSDLKKIQKEEKKQEKETKKAEKKKQKEVNETDFSEYAVNSGVEDPDEILPTDSFSEKMKKRKKLQAKPRFIIDENGEFDINTSDVEIVGEETGREYAQKIEQSYSIKKSRGDYIPPKIKWWEIYKFADRHFARSKIKKEVNKASKIKPNFVKKSKLILLAIFLGWTGAHNFYAKNIRRGFVSLFCTLIAFTTLIVFNSITVLSEYYELIDSLQTWLVGGTGFVGLYIWLSDIISISFNQFRYRFQRDRFIAGLNVTTRAKLGKKYIDMDLYHKPLWYRFKVWCGEVRKNSAIRKRERRQAAIEREKFRQQQQEEKDRINSEIAAFEEKENQELSKKNNQDVIDESIIEEIKTFEKEDGVEIEVPEQSNNEPKHKSTFAPKKYNKTVKNKKAEKRKKKK